MGSTRRVAVGHRSGICLLAVSIVIACNALGTSVFGQLHEGVEEVRFQQPPAGLMSNVGAPADSVDNLAGDNSASPAQAPTDPGLNGPPQEASEQNGLAEESYGSIDAKLRSEYTDEEKHSGTSATVSPRVDGRVGSRRLSGYEEIESEEVTVEDGVTASPLLASKLFQEAIEGLTDETGSAPSEDKEGIEDSSVIHSGADRRRLSDDEQNASEEAPAEDGVASLLASELVHEALEGLTEETGSAPSEDKEGIEDGSALHGESDRRRLSDDEQNVLEEAPAEDGVASLLASELVQEALEGLTEETGSAPLEDKEGIEDGSVLHGESDRRRLSDDEQNVSEGAPVEDGVASLLASETVQEAIEGLTEETGSAPSEDKEGIEDGSVHHGESDRRRLSDDEQNASEEAPAEDGVARLLASELVQEALEGLTEETGSAPSEDKEGIEDGSVLHSGADRRRLSDDEQNASEEAPAEDGVTASPLLASELVQEALEGLTDETGSAPSEDKEGIEDGSVHHGESDRRRLSDDEQNVLEEAPAEDGVASLLASELVQEALEGLTEETGSAPLEDKEGIEDGSVHHGESDRRRLSDDEQNASEEAPAEDGVASLLASELVHEALEGLTEETGSAPSEDKEGIEDGSVHHGESDRRRLSDDEQNVSEGAPVEDGVASLLASETVQEAIEGLTEETGSAPSEDKEGIEDSSVLHSGADRRRLSDDEQNASEEAPAEDGVTASPLLASEPLREALEGLMEETGSVVSEDKGGIEDGFVLHSGTEHRRLGEVALDPDNESFSRVAGDIQGSAADVVGANGAESAEDGCLQKSREAEMPPVTALEQPPEVAHVEVDLGVSTDVRRLSNEQDGDGEQPASETVEEGDYEGEEKDFGPTIPVLPGTDVDFTETALPVGTSEDLGHTLSDVTEEGIEHQKVFSLRRRLAATETTRESRDHDENSPAGSNVNHAAEAEGGATDDADAHMLNDISEEATEQVNQDPQCTAEALTLRRLLAEEEPSAETVDPDVPETEWEDEGHCGCGHCADIDLSTSAYSSTEDSSTSDLENDAVPNTNAFLRGAAVAHQ